MNSSTSTDGIRRRHLAAGWLGLLLFLSLGIAIEAMHGFKLPFYLDSRNATRRLMWTLAHTHGTLLSLVNIAFSVTLATTSEFNFRRARIASRSFLGALALLPSGFFLGGVWLHGGDPGLGIFLVPPGALLLLLAVGMTLRGVWPRGGTVEKPGGGSPRAGKSR